MTKEKGKEGAKEGLFWEGLIINKTEKAFSSMLSEIFFYTLVKQAAGLFV